MTDVRIVTESLGGSPLSRLLQGGAAPEGWMPRAPRTAEEWSVRARARMEERDWSAALAALAPAFDASGAAAERLERVRREGGVVVTTGQQPGLFGGPIYTWSKAMGALALADEIERATGIATVAVFWAATDDADFAESSTTMVARVGGVDVLRDDMAPPVGTPMALAPLGDVTMLLTGLLHSAGSAADPRPLDALSRAYARTTTTVGGAYLALLRELLAPLGVPVLDASHAAVRAASLPVLHDALRGASRVEAALAARTAQLVAAGHSPQVELVAGLSLVFERVGEIKARVALSDAEARSRAESSTFTPNVLLRPIVERAILPTVAYLGGPGEMTYFAQVSAAAEALGLVPPLALPRWSCTLIEPDVDRLLAQFGVEVAALTDPHALEGAVAHGFMHAGSAAALAAARRAIAALPEGVGAEAEALGLSAAVQGAMQSLQHRMDRLERRLVAGIKRREHDQLRDVATLRAALYPRGTRQERALNLLPFLARHGLALLAEMRDAAAAHARSLVARS